MRNNLQALIHKKEREERKRLSFSKIARNTGVSRTTIWRLLEDPERGMSTETINNLCKYFGCNIGDLISLEDEENNVNV